MRLVPLLLALGCGGKTAPPVELAVVGESTRVRLEDRFPAATPWFDGRTVTLVAARGETIGLQVLHRADAVQLAIPGARVRGFDVTAFAVSRPSTSMYGGSRGTGRYADGLTETATPRTRPAYFEVLVEGEPGKRAGTLVVGGRTVPVELAVVDVTLPPLPRMVWAYEDPRELAWQGGVRGDAPLSGREPGHASEAERQCIALFREHGVLLSPDLHLDWWAARAPLIDGFPHVPVMISTEPERAAEEVRGWIAATRGTGQVPFTIPIDEPRTAQARARVKTLSAAVRAAGGGPTTFRYAVTHAPHAELGDSIDLYIAWHAAHLAGDPYERWTYNGNPPYAGSSVLDAQSPGARTWGWIGWRWKIGVWYVWDALYWHDRHNRKGKPLPGRPFDPADPVTFDNGEDRGNLDGVLALPAPHGCLPTLRLAAIRRGLIDRQLLDLAAHCAPDETAKLAARVVPSALGDADGKRPSWSTDEATWELARRRLLELASCPREP